VRLAPSGRKARQHLTAKSPQTLTAQAYGSYEGWGVKAKIVRVPRAQVRPTTVALTLW
jgi:hypothetical protein